MTTKKISKTSNYLLGAPLNHNAGLRARYERELRTLVSRMTDETTRRVLRLFDSSVGEEYFDNQRELVAMDASISSQAKILMNALYAKFYKIFSDKSGDLAKKTVKNIANTSKNQFRSSLEKLSDKLSLPGDFIPAGVKEVSKASVSENVSLIKSIPEKYFAQITGAVMRSITTGEGVDQLKRHFKKYDSMTDRRAKNIALDQTRKAYNSINAQRMKAAGYKKFRWLHSGGGLTPRPLHVAMDGKIYSFDNLPIIDKNTGETGIPGQLPNCGCTMQPVYEFPEGENE